MTTFDTVRVAAVQATPVILDAEATIDKALGLLNTAADDGVQLAVLPETFVSLYPSGGVGCRRGPLQRLRRALGAHVGQLGRRAGAVGGPHHGDVRRARDLVRHRRQRA